MGALLVTLLLGASDVSLSVAPGVVCVDQSRLAARLERQGVQVRAKSERLAVTIELVGANVVVRGLKRGGGVLERSVPAKVDDCAAIERVIAAMITSWSKSPLPRGEGQGEGENPSIKDAGIDAGAGASATIPSPAPAGEGQGEGQSPKDAGSISDLSRDAGALVSSSRDARISSPAPAGEDQGEGQSPKDVGAISSRSRDAGSTPDTSSSFRDDGAVAAVVSPTLETDSRAEDSGRSLTPNPLPEGEGAGTANLLLATDAGTANLLPTDAGTADTVLPTDAGTTDALLSTAGSSSTSFEIAALGGTALGPTASFTGRGQASVALAFTRFGVSLDVGLESARTRTVAPVTVTSTAQWASLNGLIHFRPLDRLRLSLSLGVRLWRIAAETTGADANATTALASFGGVAATTATIRLIGPLSAQLSLYASSRWRAERFNVSNLGPVLELLPWEGGLLGGLVLEANFL